MNHSDAYRDAWNEAAGEASAETDEQLAERIGNLTHMDAARITELFPDKADAKKLEQLMEAVATAQDDNEAMNRIADNIQTFGGVIVRLLKFVV